MSQLPPSNQPPQQNVPPQQPPAQSASTPHDPYQSPQVHTAHAVGEQQAASALDAIIPTNPLAAVSCWSGIIGLLLCPLGVLLGPLALITGIISLKKSKATETAYGKTTSAVRSWIGIVTGGLATCAGIVTVISMLIQR